MAKKSKSMIGHNPLAWLKEGAEDAEITEVEEKVETKVKQKNKTSSKKSAKAKPIFDEIVIEIQSTQDISSISELYENMKELLSFEKVIFDATQVERIDAASLQLLYSFITQAKVNNIDVSWRSPSESLIKSANLLGMEEALLLDNVA